MSWRTVVIKSQAKLSYKNNYMIVRGDEIKLVHLSEIGTLLIDSTMISVTTHLISELLQRKIKVIFCDEKRNPVGEIIPYYGSHNTSKKIAAQFGWTKQNKALMWTMIVRQKIINQSALLRNSGRINYNKLLEYIDEIELGDSTNREGHAAKVYFNSLFEKGFSREQNNSVNGALNYGYAILLSSFNKAVAALGYLTQIGINHRNEFNYYNLSCDLMEPFRPLVDELVFKNKDRVLDGEYKMMLVDLLNGKHRYGGKEYLLTNIIDMYTHDITKAIESGKIPKEIFELK